jgi:hypothetical protein
MEIDMRLSAAILIRREEVSKRKRFCLQAGKLMTLKMNTLHFHTFE